ARVRPEQGGVRRTAREVKRLTRALREDAIERVGRDGLDAKTVPLESGARRATRRRGRGPGAGADRRCGLLLLLGRDGNAAWRQLGEQERRPAVDVPLADLAAHAC